MQYLTANTPHPLITNDCSGYANGTVGYEYFHNDFFQPDALWRDGYASVQNATSPVPSAAAAVRGDVVAPRAHKLGALRQQRASSSLLSTSCSLLQSSSPGILPTTDGNPEFVVGSGIPVQDGVYFAPHKNFPPHNNITLPPGHEMEVTNTGYRVKISQVDGHYIPEMPTTPYASGNLRITPENVFLPPPRLNSTPLSYEDRVKVFALWLLRHSKKQKRSHEEFLVRLPWMWCNKPIRHRKCAIMEPNTRHRMENTCLKQTLVENDARYEDISVVMNQLRII